MVSYYFSAHGSPPNSPPLPVPRTVPRTNSLPHTQPPQIGLLLHQPPPPSQVCLRTPFTLSKCEMKAVVFYCLCTNSREGITVVSVCNQRCILFRVRSVWKVFLKIQIKFTFLSGESNALRVCVKPLLIVEPHLKERNLSRKWIYVHIYLPLTSHLLCNYHRMQFLLPQLFLSGLIDSSSRLIKTIPFIDSHKKTKWKISSSLFHA